MSWPLAGPDKQADDEGSDHMSIDDELTARFRAACQESRALGYAPVRMEQMLSGTGAVKAAKWLVASADLQSGLKELAKLERLDLSLESIMLEPQFRGAFTDQELAAAQWRLDQARTR